MEEDEDDEDEDEDDLILTRPRRRTKVDYTSVSTTCFPLAPPCLG